MHLRSLTTKPPGYALATILTSLGGFLFGHDTGIIGPATVMAEFTKYVGSSSPTIHGLIVSSILIPAAVSSFFAGTLADTLGRPRGIAIGSLIFAIGAALEGASIHIAMFVVGRIIEGIGEGLYLGTLVVYICEIAPPKHRGPLTTGPQLLITLGLVVGFFTCYGTANIPSSLSWRLPFLLLAGYSFAFSAAVYLYLPASPRWLTLHGKADEAAAIWDKLDVPAADREKIINQFELGTIQPASDENPSSSTISFPDPRPTPATQTRKPTMKLPEVLSSDSRPRLLMAVFLMGMQQLSGIDGVLYYAPLLFQQAGLSSIESTFLASGLSAIVIFAVSIPALVWADSWGRRVNTIYGGLGMTATMLLMGGLYAGDAVHADAGPGRWVVIVSIYLFAVLYTVSWGVGIRIFAAEIQPQKTRASATNIAHGSNWLTNFLVALVTPTLLAKTSYGAYFLFGGCTFVTAVACWLFMPETRGKSLDEIDQAFRESQVSGLKERVTGVLRRRVKSRMPTTVDA
ncbi:general substrate transporter [Podospora appendiculata]|uniref:General substrate transporter n=1 Tax=Podospora appendiculata TaxID=314037 RepID=A0AAE0X3J2_9PEZI|nr:general substrate transporter [Podospora appendiculata]